MPITKSSGTKIPRKPPRFYKKKSGTKKVLKAVIRPTHKNALKSASKITVKDQKTTESPSQQPDTQLIPPNQNPQNQEKTEIDELNTLVTSASNRLRQLEKSRIDRQKDQKDQFADDPKKFDGTNNPSDDLILLRQQLNHFQKENKKLSEELTEIKSDFRKEKEQLQKDVKKLTKEVRQTTEPQDNKFFSFSKELSEAIKAIEGVSQDPVPQTNTNVNITQQEPISETSEQQPKQFSVSAQPKPQPSDPDTHQNPPPPPPQQPSENQQSQPNDNAHTPAQQAEKKTKRPKKALITGASLMAMLAIGGAVSHRLTSRPNVDQDLVSEYLDKGTVQGIQSSEEFSNTGKSKTGVTADKNAEISYNDTIWEVFEDNFLGVQVQDPVNAAERLHGANSVTFLRKESFIFKIQRFETELNLNEFWEKNQDGTVKYSASPLKLKNRDILHLKLDDSVEFPGDRYLFPARKGGYIFDIWFATESDKFSDDDVQRAKHMLDSIRILI